ncbi:MAG: PHP domain-containing protein, partial [Clostridia bacterium]|nr:PHP domain-containing protein [Clostridia bacterium]
MKKYCDLHTHSVFSDGTWTPSQIIEKAGSLGLSSVALCDHNTVGGLPDFLKAAEGKDIE